MEQMQGVEWTITCHLRFTLEEFRIGEPFIRNHRLVAFSCLWMSIHTIAICQEINRYSQTHYSQAKGDEVQVDAAYNHMRK